MTIAVLGIGGFVLGTVDSGETVLLLQEVIRHGSRTPIYRYFELPWARELGKSDLTSVGFNQHYLGGKELRRRYPQFFDH